MFATLGAGERRPISSRSSSEVGRLDEAGIGPGLACGLNPADRLVQSSGGHGVRPGDDEEIASAPRVDGGPDLLHVIVAADDSLAAHVSALLGPHLVFQEAARGPCRDQFVDSSVHIQGVAIAGIGIDDDRDLHAHADPPGTVDHLGLREQAHVRFSDRGCRNRIAGNECHREPDALGDSRREGVKYPGKRQSAECVQDTVDTRISHDRFPRDGAGT